MKLLLVTSFLVCFEDRHVDSSQRDVSASIFKGYQKNFRPVHDDNTIMFIQIQPKILSLLEVNAEQEYITVAIFITQQWKDEYLTWDPSNFNGTTTIKAPASTVWVPDITVSSSSLKPEYFFPEDDRIVDIQSDGTVSQTVPFLLTNYCKMKIKEYPFDTQECIIQIGSWTYMKEQLTLQHTLMDGYDASKPINNNTVWDILPYENETFEVPNGPGQTIIQLWYRQKIKRKPQYYIWVLIAPTFIITALSLAGLYAPFNSFGDREEKTTLGLTTLLTLAIILTMVSGEMPRGSSLPLLGQFVLVEIIMIVVSVAISVVTMFLHERTTTRLWPVPSWLMLICLCQPHRAGNAADEQEMIFENTHRDKIELDDHLKRQSTYGEAILLGACLRQLRATYTRVNGWLNRKEEEKMQVHQWLMVFDRLDLILFLSFQIIHIVAFILIFYPYFGTLD